jgi:citrate synthase
MNKDLQSIRKIILEAAEIARRETQSEPEPENPKAPKWPIPCTVGPGLEGAIACESKVGYVNGAKGWLVYRGYDIFDLAANATYEEVCFLLLHGHLPNATELNDYRMRLNSYMHLNTTLRLLMGFPVEEMITMGALRLGTNLMRQEFTDFDKALGQPKLANAIGSDEDSIAMETKPLGDKHAIYEFKIKDKKSGKSPVKIKDRSFERTSALESCYHLIAGVSTIIGAVARIHQGRLPIEPDPQLSHAANLLYMITGKKPDPVEEKIMDISLILHADHGMNASTFASMVVASTLADIYFAVGSGIAALSGPLHGGANEAVIRNLSEINSVKEARRWVEQKLAKKSKISGFGHRVYKAYDPRARVLGPLAKFLSQKNEKNKHLVDVATEVEKIVVEKLSKEKKIFPNVDFYSGIVYRCLGLSDELFTPLFAASRVAGWTARVWEYIEKNRIFRPRAIYVGDFNKHYVPIKDR